MGTGARRRDLLPDPPTAAVAIQSGGVQPADLWTAADRDYPVRARRTARAATAGAVRSAMSSAALLRLESVTRRFGGLVAVREVSLAVAPGELVGLGGPHGR